MKQRGFGVGAWALHTKAAQAKDSLVRTERHHHLHQTLVDLAEVLQLLV